MEKPDFIEWKKQNPGKSINDYFMIYPPEPTGKFKVPTERYSRSYLDDSNAQQTTNSSKVSHRSIWPYIIITLIIVITFFSNPKRDEHTFAVELRLTSLLEKTLEEETTSAFDYNIGIKVVGPAIYEIVNRVSTENYLFFSLTKVNYQTDSKTIGIGILGKVYLSDRLELLVKELVSEYKNMLE